MRDSVGHVVATVDKLTEQKTEDNDSDKEQSAKGSFMPNVLGAGAKVLKDSVITSIADSFKGAVSDNKQNETGEENLGNSNGESGDRKPPGSRIFKILSNTGNGIANIFSGNEETKVEKKERNFGFTDVLCKYKPRLIK